VNRPPGRIAGRRRGLAGSGPRAGAPAPRGFELQLHPAGRRGRVRYFRLTRAHLVCASALGLLYLLLLAVAAGMAPGVVAGAFGGAEYRALAASRSRHGERLLALVRQLEQLRARGEGLLGEVRQVAAAYELPAVPVAPPPMPRPPGAGAPGTGGGNTGPPPGGGGATQAGGPEGGSAPQAAGTGTGDGGDASSIYDGAVRQGERLRARIAGQLGGVEAELVRLREFEAAHPEAVREMPAACPLRGGSYVLTNPFGREQSAFLRGLGFHGGIDLAAPRGTPIRASADGVVAFAGVYPLARSPAWWRLGQLVAVAHGERYLTIYGHCDELKVGARQPVRRGEVLATVGSSGWSLGPHLHYEVRRRTAAGALLPVNPLIYVLDRRWPDEERLLARGFAAPRDYEPLPPGLDPKEPISPRRRHRRTVP
jgi:murein DD-endopeptidase MepM/ murein hydrolase activator NlpD